MQSLHKIQLLSLMQQGATIITPNNRLSNELLTNFFNSFPKKVKVKPSCLPYQNFLLNTFKLYCQKYPFGDHPILLTSHQASHLWRQILSEENISFTQGLVNAVEEAWERCHLWCLNPTDGVFVGTQQTQLFRRWAQRYREKLDQLSAITLPQLVEFFLNKQDFLQKKAIIWACFNEYNPQQQKLQRYFLDNHCPLYSYDSEIEEGHSQVLQYAAKNEEDEYQQLFYWLKERRACGEKRIGLVVPDLQARIPSLRRMLQKHFLPDDYNISLGKPLTEYPLVSHALRWLHLGEEDLDIHDVRLLLHSPFIGHSQIEFLARSQFLESHPLLGEAVIKPGHFIEALGKQAPLLAQALSFNRKYPKTGSVSTWIKFYFEKLRALGFPGEIPLNSSLYQQYQRFLLLFDEFKQLNLITPHLTKTEALTVLSDLAKNTIFQPKNNTSAPIQILGLLEASGCLFDSLWLTNFTDNCCPQPLKPSPFIPAIFQHDQRMPRANFTRELDLAQKTISRFKKASPLVIFSYPELSKDQVNIPSPFLENLPSYQPLFVASITRSLLEPTTETYLLPLGDEEKLRGTTALLSNQAKCPFRAFAAHRLHAKSYRETVPGLHPKERGQLLHKVMELWWKIVKTQKNLLQLNQEQLTQCVDEVIQSALGPWIQHKPYSLSPIFQEVEVERLKKLVYACLAWERERQEFEVLATEVTSSINLAGMEFNLRIDRLDRVKGEKQWVIDYKTNFPPSLPWYQIRPKEPQLLLYALLDDKITTLVFTQLKANELQVKGLSEEDVFLPGVNTLKKELTWEVLKKQWEKELTQLTREVIEGYSPPLPANATLCQQCDYQSLCRYEKG